jgi:endonuclease YncB( thermonuclease family)
MTNYAYTVAGRSPIRLGVILITFGMTASLPAVAVAEVMGAQKSKVYHTQPDRCGAAKTIASGNRISFKSVQEAETEGRRQCKSCARIEAKIKEEASKPKEPETRSGEDKKSEPQKGETESDEGSEAGRKPGQPASTTNGESDLVEIVRVARVLPGATLELEGGERVRLSGIGAPINGQPSAREAQKKLEKLVKGRKVTVAWETDDESMRDRYGRRAAFAAIGSDREDIGGTLIQEGLAWVDRSSDFTQLSEYLRREDDAAWGQRGIWKRLKGSHGAAKVIVGKFTREYHSPYCPHSALLIEPATISVNEAKGRRLAPCEFWRSE